jgi:hypothetical protein
VCDLEAIGASAKVVTRSIELELFATTSRESLNNNNRDLDAHGRGKECLSETSRPGFISTMRSDLPQPTHRLEEKDSLKGHPLPGTQDCVRRTESSKTFFVSCSCMLIAKHRL